MISKVILQYADEDLSRRFKYSRQEFYRKAIPLIAGLLFILAIALEIIYRMDGLELGELSKVTSAINWCYFVGFIALSCFVRRWSWPGHLVCPLLTIIVFYYFAFVDFQKSAAVLYFTLIIALTTGFFFVVVFNENWILSTITYAVCITVLMYRIGVELLGEETYELVIKAVYSTFIYGVIAYLGEVRGKQAYVGAESSDKAFYKWLKIFETFPEGIALVRNNYILYANKSLKNILEIQSDQYMQGHPDTNKNDLLKRQLMETKVIPYQSGLGGRDQKQVSTNVWQFLARNEKGSTFELPFINHYDEEKTAGSSVSKKFITLNQVNVNVTGSKDKLLIIRDVSHIIFLEQIMETKHQMSIFTDNLMKQIQGYAEFTSSNLQKLDKYVDHNGKPLAEESYDEINKMLYRIKDFEQVYNIAEQKFRVKEEEFSIKKCMDEVIQIAQHELQKKNIDLSVSNATDLPSSARGDAFKFKQVLLNLILQSISGTYKGFVKIYLIFGKYNFNGPHVSVEIENSKFELHKKDNMRIMKLTQQTEFKKILESKVDINLKIAKILTNALNWKIDFSAFKGCKYTMTFPLVSEGIKQAGPSPQDKYEEYKNRNESNSIQTHANNNLITAKGIDEDIEEEIKNLSKNQYEDQQNAQNVESNRSIIPLETPKPKGPPPMFIKSTCCGQALLLSLKELVGTLEDNIGLRCDEAYLEDSAIRFLKDCFKPKKCSCQPYKFIFVDMDDPTISIKRFMTTVVAITKEQGVSILVYGCGTNENRARPQCTQAGAEFLKKPVTPDALRVTLPQ